MSWLQYQASAAQTRRRALPRPASTVFPPLVRLALASCTYQVQDSEYYVVRAIKKAPLKTRSTSGACY